MPLNSFRLFDNRNDVGPISKFGMVKSLCAQVV